MADAEPRYGYGAHGRELWTQHDRDAEDIRSLLRQYGHRESGSKAGGFAVETVSARAAERGLFVVVCTDKALRASGELGRYAELLLGDGYQVMANPRSDLMIEVWKPPVTP